MPANTRWHLEVFRAMTIKTRLKTLYRVMFYNFHETIKHFTKSLCIAFYPNEVKNVKNKGKILFLPLSEVCIHCTNFHKTYICAKWHNLLLAIIWDRVPCSLVNVSEQPAPSIIMINAPNLMTEAAGSCVMSVHISQSITLKICSYSL